MIRLVHITVVGALALAAPATTPREHEEPLPADTLCKENLWLCEEIEDAWLQAGGDRPVYSTAISRAAAHLLDRSEDTSAQDLPPYWSRTVRFELLREGVRDPHFLPLLLEGDHPTELLERLRWVLESDLCPVGLNRYGFSLGRRNGRLRLSLVLVHRLVELGTFPAVVDPGHSQLFWGSWDPGYGAPRVLVASPGGGLMELVPREAAEMFWTRLYFPEEGVYTVEVMLSGPGGPETAALFDVYAGVPSPALPSIRLCAPHEGSRTEDLEAALLSMMNRERVRRGIEPLRQDPMLQQCARQHSQAMATRQLLAHRLPDPRNQSCPPARQNIAMGRALCGAHQQLMESPSHRRNILDKEATACGVGVSAAEVMPGVDLYYITQEFTGGGAADRGKEK